MYCFVYTQGEYCCVFKCCFMCCIVLCCVVCIICKRDR